MVVDVDVLVDVVVLVEVEVEVLVEVEVVVIGQTPHVALHLSATPATLQLPDVMSKHSLGSETPLHLSVGGRSVEVLVDVDVVLEDDVDVVVVDEVEVEVVVVVVLVDRQVPHSTGQYTCHPPMPAAPFMQRE
jgi:hypothetical protein